LDKKRVKAQKVFRTAGRENFTSTIFNANPRNCFGNWQEVDGSSRQQQDDPDNSWTLHNCALLICPLAGKAQRDNPPRKIQQVRQPPPITPANISNAMINVAASLALPCQ
jgi:hypothetical protein